MAINRAKILESVQKYLKANKVPQAISELQKLVDDNPKDHLTLNQIGDLHARVGNKDGAIQAFIKVADHLSHDGFALKAIASLKKVTRLDPVNPDALERLGNLNHQQGFIKEAKNVWEVLGAFYTKSGQIDKAIPVYKKIVETEPSNYKNRVTLGDLLLRIGQKTEGLKEYISAGTILANEGKTKESAMVFDRALTLDPQNIDSIRGVVSTHITQGQGKQACDLLKGMLEKDPNNKVIHILLADTYKELKEIENASSEYKRVIDLAPNDINALGQYQNLLLVNKRFDEAYKVVKEAAENLIKQSLYKAASALYEEVLRFSPDHIPSLKSLRDIYRQQKSPFNLINTLSHLSDALIGKEELKEAGGALEELITLEPENDQYKKKLTMVQSRLGIKPQPPKAAPVKPSEPEKKEEEFDVEVEMEEIEATPSKPQIVVEKVPSEIKEQKKNGALPEINLDLLASKAPKTTIKLDKKGDRLSKSQQLEVDTFIKYGMLDRAIDYLVGILKKSSENIEAHQKLVEIYKKSNRNDRAVSQMVRLARIFKERGDITTFENLVDEASSLDPNNPILAKIHGEAPSAQITEEPIKQKMEEISFDNEEVEVAPEPVLKEEAATEEILKIDLTKEEVETSAEISQRIEEIEFYISQDLLDEARNQIEPLLLKYPDNSTLADINKRLKERQRPAGDVEEVRFFEEAMQEPISGDEKVISVEDESEVVEEHEKTMPDLSLEPEEENIISFEEEPFTDKQDLAEEPIKSELQEPEIHNQTIREPEEEPPISVMEEPAESESEEPISLTDALESSEESMEDENAGVISIKEGGEEPKQESGEGEFFDLASELGEALFAEQEESSIFEEPKSSEEVSFEQVFESFKKGVDQKVGEDDFETRYNLGIAYKEMDLVDEAIGEFQQAARGPQFFIDSCSMLGLCFRQKSLHDLAEKWYLKGINEKGINEDQRVGLKYDLGETYEEMGNEDKAVEIFKEIYAINSNYREVKKKIKALIR